MGGGGSGGDGDDGSAGIGQGQGVGGTAEALGGYVIGFGENGAPDYGEATRAFSRQGVKEWCRKRVGVG